MDGFNPILDARMHVTLNVKNRKPYGSNIGILTQKGAISVYQTDSSEIKLYFYTNIFFVSVNQYGR